GSSYVCANGGGCPSSSVPGSSGDWQLLAEAGDTGATGPTGPTGANGATGPTGADRKSVVWEGAETAAAAGARVAKRGASAGGARRACRGRETGARRMGSSPESRRGPLRIRDRATSAPTAEDVLRHRCRAAVGTGSFWPRPATPVPRARPVRQVLTVPLDRPVQIGRASCGKGRRPRRPPGREWPSAARARAGRAGLVVAGRRGRAGWAVHRSRGGGPSGYGIELRLRQRRRMSFVIGAGQQWGLAASGRGRRHRCHGPDRSDRC